MSQSAVRGQIGQSAAREQIGRSEVREQIGRSASIAGCGRLYENHQRRIELIIAIQYTTGHPIFLSILIQNP